MASNEKLFNKQIFTQILRKVGWIGVLYQILLLAFVSAPLLLKCVKFEYDPNFSGEFYPSLFYVATGFQAMTLLFVPVILGMFLYYFLTNEKAAVFTHSLPLSRRSIYMHHTLSGVVILVLPIFITMFVTWIIISTSTLPADVKELYVYSDWILIACSVVLGMFSLSTISAMITGNFIIQGALTLGIVFSPIIIYEGLIATISSFFYGFAYQLTYILPSPLDAIYQYSTVAISVSMIILFISYFVYLRRDVENSSESVVFRSIRPIFKYGLTIVGLLIFSKVTSSFYTTTILYYISMVVGSLVGYFSAELILKKGRLSFRNFKGFIVFSGTFAVFFVGMLFCGSNYENNIPNASEISSVTISSNYYQLSNEEIQQAFEDVYTLTEEESFTIFTEIHQQLIDEKPDGHGFTGYNDLKITYNLQNGDQLSRTYQTAFLGENAKMTLAEKFIDIPELTENFCEFLDDTVRNNAEYFRVTANAQNGSITYEIPKTDEDAFNSFIDALIADIKTVGLTYSTYESGVSEDDNYEEYINFAPAFKSTHGESYPDVLNAEYCTITKEYENTIKWFEENGYEDLANHLNPAD